MKCESVVAVLCCVWISSLLTGDGKPTGKDKIGKTAKCLECICEAASGCNMTLGCVYMAVSDYYCGPYHISYNYWDDAGRLGEDPDDPDDYKKCLNDKFCAGKTVLGYMEKWGTDCNGNGKVDCDDWVRIHKTGAGDCKDSWVTTTTYYRRFDTCFNKL
ncbi:Lysozyme, partial [Stegodyphus mimosarum]